MITRIDHLNLVVSDLAAASAFFALLGFTPGPIYPLDGAFLARLTGLSARGGRFTPLRHPTSPLVLELLQFETTPPAGTDPGQADGLGLRHLAFAVDDIEAEVARLSAHGIVFNSPIQTWTATGKKLVYFNGPDNILLELAEYPQGAPP